MASYPNSVWSKLKHLQLCEVADVLNFCHSVLNKKELLKTSQSGKILKSLNSIEWQIENSSNK